MNATKVRVALYRLDLGRRFFGADWHWARLAEIAELLAVSSQEVYGRFGPLVRPVRGAHFGQQLPWVFGDGFCCRRGKEHCEPGPTAFNVAGPRNQMYVPAGWAQDVLDAHELGVVRVERFQVDSRTPTPPGALYVIAGRSSGQTRDDLKTVIVGLDASDRPIVVPGKEGRELLR